MRWIPFACLAVGLGLSVAYLWLSEVECGGDSPFFRIWFLPVPLILLFSLLVARVFTRDERMRGRHPWLWLGLAWIAVAAVYVVAYYRQLGCLS